MPGETGAGSLLRRTTRASTQWLGGVVCYHLKARKKVVLIISPVRSGSTLLKALLANSADVSHIDEFNFQSAARSRYVSYWRIWRLSPRPILVLKKPAWFGEADTYPRLPKYRHQAILLYRDPLGTILSIKNRMKVARYYPALTNEQLLDYWCRIFENACAVLHPRASDVRLVRYNDLVSDPVASQQRLFAWMGTSRYEARATYKTPDSGEWSWQRDDGGDTIKTGVVHKPRHLSDPILESLIARSARVTAIERLLARYDSGDRGTHAPRVHRPASKPS